MLNLRIIFLAMGLCLIPAWPGGQATPGWSEGPGLSRAKAKGMSASAYPGAASSAPQIRTFVLEPFYFFREHQGRVQVERVIITLETPVAEKETSIDWCGEIIRSAFLRILSQGMDQDSQQQQAQELLRRQFGQQDPVNVKITRSVLLMP
jgi:hypothetical protein